MSASPQREFDRLVREAVQQIRKPVRELEARDLIISYHSDYPSLGHFDSGQPKVTHGKGPIDYSHLFKVGKVDRRWYASFDDVPALQDLAEVARDDDRLRTRLLLPGAEGMTEARERFLLIGAATVPLEVFDRLMNVVGADFTHDDFEAIWVPMRNGLVWDELPVEIVVPVCLTTFEPDEPVQLDTQTRLEPLTEDEQRARVPDRIWFGSANDCVVAAATHAIVLSDFYFEGDNRMVADYGRPQFYPLDRIEKVFEALRIATAAPIGYAQIFMRPLGWVWDYKADLPPLIQGSISRRYPPAFDNYGWLQKPVEITSQEVDRAGQVLRHLVNATKRQRLAFRRLSSAALRDDEDDAILDLCIALEAALGDRQRSEMTYKLSLRSAALLSAQNKVPGESAEVMRRVKQLYNWRSAIVHGDEVEKARQKFLGVNAASEDPLATAISLLRRLLFELVLQPELSEVEKIDTSILLGRPDSGASVEASP